MDSQDKIVFTNLKMDFVCSSFNCSFGKTANVCAVVILPCDANTSVNKFE